MNDNISSFNEAATAASTALDEISPEASSPVKTQTAEQLPIEEPVQVASVHPAEQVARAPVDDPTRNFKRGPKCKVPRRRGGGGGMRSSKEVAGLAAAAGIPIAVVGLNAARVTSCYRINLKQESLAGALTFALDALRHEDKAKIYEVVLYGPEVSGRIEAAVAALGLNECYDRVCPEEPMILEARLTRIPPHTTSLSVAWPDDLKAPTVGRTRVLLVPVMEIRVQPDGIQAAPSGASLPASAQENQ